MVLRNDRDLHVVTGAGVCESLAVNPGRFEMCSVNKDCEKRRGGRGIHILVLLYVEVRKDSHGLGLRWQRKCVAHISN